ncbi:MAG: thiamine-phosphate kinase [Burkholderiales bacterium]|nr:thiamine-phosphate kinase [Burkholderiales bacterium]
MGEFDIIARYFTRPARSAGLGVGDDAALVVAPTGLTLAITTDMLLEGRHFAKGVDPAALGHKALAVNLSDLAAMGADPRWFTLAIALPAADEAWLDAFANGLFALADREKCELIGGDTTRGPLTIAITAIGTLPTGHALRRDGACVGDDVWLSGATGEAALALAHAAGRVALPPGDAERCRERLDRPQPRVGLGRRLRSVANAAIDVSDGLAADLGHILERSKVGAEIELEAIPRAAPLVAAGDARLATECLLAGGDDYELVFTASPERRDAVARAAAAAGVPVSRIGRIVAGSALAIRDARGEPVALARAGFDHFAGGTDAP